MFRLVIPLVVIALSACTPRATLDVVEAPDGVGTRSTVFVGTTRGSLTGAPPESYARDDLSYAQFEVSIPPTHTPGKINLPGRETPDPNRHFVITDSELDMPQPEFRKALARAFRKEQGHGILYVHGFNNVAADGVNRIAQMHNDIGINGVLMSYSWPSAGSPVGYAHDRDSALFARDGLAEMITTAGKSGGRKIILVAHSMGTLLTMEALRTLALQGSDDVLDHLAAVILIAPDIDVDVFKAQAKAIGDLPEPFVIFTSDEDRALRLSALLSGQTNRLGTLEDVEAVEDLEVALLDVSQFNSDSKSSHFIFGSSPRLLRLLSSLGDLDAAFQQGAAVRIGLLPGTVLTVRRATQVILFPNASPDGAAEP